MILERQGIATGKKSKAGDGDPRPRYSPKATFTMLRRAAENLVAAGGYNAATLAIFFLLPCNRKLHAACRTPQAARRSIVIAV